MSKNRFLFAVLFLLAAVCGCRRGAGTQGGEDEVKVWPLGFATDTLRLEETEVRAGEVFGTLFSRLGMPSADAHRLALACGGEFDVRRLRAGKRIDAWYDADTLSRSLEYAVYHHNKIDMTVFRCKDSLAVWNVHKQLDTIRNYTDVTITSSLWNDMIAAGASPLLILELADVYAWTVDFFGLQKGDRFRAFYRQRECEGEVFDILDVSFAEYTRGRDTLYAICYDQGDNGNRYWNQKGESMRKAFLKAPLKFNRVSSRFTYHRKHPVYGTVRPHTGVDYAAPAGTPVHALGDGVVISAGWGGGGGNTVKIRHNSVYTTAYLHLRGFASGIKAGVRVHQGQTIGYVGSTGTSTGPHLDFRVWKNGTPVDPLRLESPSAEPIKKENLPVLDSLFRMYRQEMNARGN